MQAQPVDPRDKRWEDSWPAYRVYFWGPMGPPSSGAWASDEWRLTDTDIDQVLEWANARASGGQFVVYVEVNRSTDDGSGLVRLLGPDPTDPHTDEPRVRT